MAYVAHFAGAMVACYLLARLLARSTWTWYVPGIAILCFQAVGLALGLSAIGLPLAAGLSAYDEGVLRALVRLLSDVARGALPAGIGVGDLALIGMGIGIAATLLGSLGRSLLVALRAQRRHRDLLTLVARDDPAAPGVLVLDHPCAAAYCLPGLRPQVVVSAGTLGLLDRAQLAAVLTHERAHAAERHDLVLLPFTALCRALPGARWVGTARESVALLVEMRADDKARRRHQDAPLAAALLRFAEAPARLTPPGALGVADAHLDARVQRLLVSRRPSRLWGAATQAGAA
ncbi:MAG TPA: M56 family metallopeptidase, partial [Micromonosporaceae bacterium]